jgi:hypothetical protein
MIGSDYYLVLSKLSVEVLKRYPLF